MKYIKDFREGMHISDVYLCRHRQIQLTKNGKEYCSLNLIDKSGSVDGKIWDLGNPGIADFEANDYVSIDADVTIFNNAVQLNVRRIRKADEGEYYPSDYLPVSEYDIEEMYSELLQYIDGVKDSHLQALLRSFFAEDSAFAEKFKFASAAKTVHHGFVGGLLEHTLSVTRMCEFMSGQYPVLKRDLLTAAAIFHDIGKIRELTPYPENDYSDEGQLVGHIVIGYEMVKDRIRGMNDFPPKLAGELLHCILAHHGELEYGSPKKPAIAEAMALHYADDTDAKMELIKEVLDNAGSNNGWLGYNKFLETNIRRTNG